MTKAFWKSKTFYVNLFAIAAIGYQAWRGQVLPISAEGQASILAVVNIVLRFISHDGVGFSDSQ